MDYLRLNESLSPLVASGFKSNFPFYVKEQILQENVPTLKDIITCTFPSVHFTVYITASSGINQSLGATATPRM